MGKVPQTINQAATQVNTAIASAMTSAEKAVVPVITAELAALTGPMAPVFATLINIFIKPLISPLVSYIGGKFSKELQTIGTFTVIDLQIDQEENALSKAKAALMAAEKTGDQNAIKIALQNYADANSALIHSDGSAPPK